MIVPCLSEADKRLLEEVQQDFPLTSRPFESIGRQCGLSEEVVLNKLMTFVKEDLIRDISTLLHAKNIGYKSILVALHAADGFVEKIASRISAHPGVSHNYQRNHYFNIWFTLSISSDREFEEEVAGILKESTGVHYRIMPAIRTFKIGVNFRFSSGLKSSSHGRNVVKQTGIILSPFDRRLISLLQENMEICSEPWKALALRAGIEEKELIDRILYFKENGIIKRISAVLRHRKVGFRFNGMACFKVPDTMIVAAGEKAASFSEVSHCYQRAVYPEWEYNLFSMVHASSKEDCEAIVSEIAGGIDCSDYLILYSHREFKKERVKYFREAAVRN